MAEPKGAWKGAATPEPSSEESSGEASYAEPEQPTGQYVRAHKGNGRGKGVEERMADALIELLSECQHRLGDRVLATWGMPGRATVQAVAGEYTYSICGGAAGAITNVPSRHIWSRAVAVRLLEQDPDRPSEPSTATPRALED